MSSESAEPRQGMRWVLVALALAAFVVQVVYSSTTLVSEALMRAGSVEQSQGQVEDALLFYERAYAWNANDSDLLYLLGNVRKGVNDAEGAEEAFLESLRFAPNEAPTLISYAELLASSGELAGAEEVARRALRLVPDSWMAEHVVGVARGLGGDHAGAALHIQRALDLSGSRDPRMQVELANALYMEGEWEGALRNVNAALKQRPLKPGHHLLQGKILYAMGRSDEAVKALGWAELAYTGRLRRGEPVEEELREATEAKLRALGDG